MNVWAAAVWGVAGGLCVEALELHAEIRRTVRWNWRRPIPQGMTAYLISVVVRVGVGAALTAATAASGQVHGALTAFGLGVAAPLVIEKLARTIPVTSSARSPRMAPAPEVVPCDVHLPAELTEAVDAEMGRPAREGAGDAR